MYSPISRRSFLLSAAAGLAAPHVARAASSRPNILFLSIDDLNDWVSPLSSREGFGSGYPGIVTPNIEELAKQGTLFKSAYTCVPACQPSRTSVMYGAGANTTGIYYNGQLWKDHQCGPDAPNLVRHLRNSGYVTEGTGKIFHNFDNDLDPDDWDEYWMPENYDHSYNDRGRRVSEIANRRELKGILDFGPGDEGARADEEVAAWTAARLVNNFESGSTFQAAGLYRPHLPFITKNQFFELYPENPELPVGFYPGSKWLAANRRDLADLPEHAHEMMQLDVFRRLRRTKEYSDMLRAYLASVSFADSNIGVIMDALKKTAAASNTFIVLWSDHGYQMGEKLAFRKFSLWERSLHVPLIFVGPGILQQEIEAPVSLADIYPTLCSLVGLPTPRHCTGKDLSSALLHGTPIDDPFAISIHGNGLGIQKNEAATKNLGIRIATPEWNYIKYVDGQGELYSRAEDPHDWNNLFGTRPEFSVGSTLISELESKLPADFNPRFVFEPK